MIRFPNSELSSEFSDIEAIPVLVSYFVNTIILTLLYVLSCVDIAFCYFADVIASFLFYAFKYIF